MKLLNSITAKLQREYEARLFIDLLQPHIVKLSFNFAATEETRKIIWSFYSLKCNYKKNAFWKRQATAISSNEKNIRTLLDYYFENCSPSDDPFLSSRKNKMLLRLIRKYTAMSCTHTTPNIRERIIYLNNMIL